MASVPDNNGNGEKLDPNLVPQASLRGNTPVKQPPRKKLPDKSHGGKKRRRNEGSSQTAKHLKGAKKRRSKSRTYFSSTSSSTSSSSSSSSGSDSSSSDDEGPSMRSVIEPGTETENPVSEPIVEFAATAAFQGLSKPARKSMVGETPMPSHPDLRPKKVDSFIKKFLKRKGENFNTAMDRRQLNLAGRMLDPLAPLSHLWQAAISAEAEGTGVDPGLVIEATRRAMSLIGNASHCALVDRRKGLLAKVSPECLDLADDPELFAPGSSDLFGKKFRRAIFKDLKLSKEMDNLISRHGNGKNKPFKFFRQQPGKGPGYNPRSWNQGPSFNPRSYNERWNRTSQYRGGFSHRGRGKSSFLPNQGKQN